VQQSETREVTVKITVSGSSLCMWNCIFAHDESHAGGSRARNMNLSVLDSKNMWYLHILIELLSVLFLLQLHIHFSSFSSLLTELKEGAQLLVFILSFWLFYYETIKRELNGRLTYECRCDERLKLTLRDLHFWDTLGSSGHWNT
jgi:hypothetical protein